ncbi:hypothetical protein RHGRI_000764 [Rhododendron griersonianum]|uniref:Regulator of Vps4 activity in the MVB pathway protein n=1 Tax=Rhododendron griersonianum TaxID=479676 RepID=A0AAV6LKQ8_9ERIC|nr:hypothetical protein RHGRI_000764 [Rhododendron griersonianum]
MLDGILGRGFTSKCKSLIKPTRTRIELMRRREEATQRFLKGNLAKLLSNGLDINAYGRTEEYIAGLNLLSCYDFIEQSCEFILKQLRVIQKQRECPEECRESVGSLMFAAARFSDMPELRELRDTFQERYGSSLEHFVNHEFVEKLALKPPTMEKKLKLLQDIALEFSLNWDSKGFEQRMDNPPAFAQDQPKKYMSVHGNDEKFKLPTSKETVTKTDKQNELSKGWTEPTKDMRNCKEDSFLKRDELDRRFLRREELTGDGDKPLTPKRDNNGIPYQGRRELVAERHDSLNGKEDNALRIVRPGHSPRGKRTEFVECGYEVQNGMMNIVFKRDGQAPVPDRKPEVAATVTTVPSAGNSHYGRPEMANPRSAIQEEETERLKLHPSNALPPPYLKSKDKFVPPPYIKSKDGNCGVSTEAEHASFEFDGTAVNPLMRNRDGVVPRSEKAQRESDHSSIEDQVVGSTEKVLSYRNDIPLPRPRSIRRKPSKLSSNRDDLGNSEDAAGKGSSSSRRRDDPRRGSPILFEEDQYWKDEEERRMDKLLLHYSTKPSTFDLDKLRRKSRPHASDQIAAAVGETSHYRRAGRDTVEAMVPPPSRSVSLPRDPLVPVNSPTSILPCLDLQVHGFAIQLPNRSWFFLLYAVAT